jgi:hypothetical protein
MKCKPHELSSLQQPALAGVPGACTIRVQHDVVHVWMCVCVWLVVLCAWWCGCCFVQQKAFITLCSPVVPLLSTSKADSGLASEFRRDRAIYTAYERMLKAQHQTQASITHPHTALRSTASGPETGRSGEGMHTHIHAYAERAARAQASHCSSSHFHECTIPSNALDADGHSFH